MLDRGSSPPQSPVRPRSASERLSGPWFAAANKVTSPQNKGVLAQHHALWNLGTRKVNICKHSTSVLTQLFATDINSIIPHDMHLQTTSIVVRRFSMAEKGVKLLLSVVDTPGFGDQMDRTKR